MIEDAPNDAYIIAFFLNPEYRNAPIYKKLNPLAGSTIVISRQNSGLVATTKPPEELIKHVGVGLQKILKHEYGDTYTCGQNDTQARLAMERRNPLLAKYHPTHALTNLREQLKAYAKGADPFNRKIRSSESTLDWWSAVQNDELGDVLSALACKIFSVVPISMADERTVSTITWLNNPRRARQEVSTLQNHIKIRQWYLHKPEVKKLPHKPVVNWHDMESTILGKRKVRDVDDDLPLAGYAPPQPRHEHPQDISDGSEAGADNYIDDGASWLNGTRELDPTAARAATKKFTLGGRTDIELSSPFLRNILGDTPDGRSQHVTTSLTKTAHMESNLKHAPASVEWDTWE